MRAAIHNISSGNTSRFDRATEQRRMILGHGRMALLSFTSSIDL